MANVLEKDETIDGYSNKISYYMGPFYSFHKVGVLVNLLFFNTYSYLVINL